MKTKLFKKILALSSIGLFSLIFYASAASLAPLQVYQGGTSATSSAAARTQLGAVATSRNVNSSGILSGGGDLSADRTITLTTSTLYQQFSATSPVSFNTSTGVLSWSNSLGFLTNASITATSPVTWSAGNVIACATCGSGTIGTSTALTSGQIDVSSGAGTIANDANFTWSSSTQLFVVVGTSTILRLSIGTSTAPASTDVLTLQGIAGNLINAKNGGTSELTVTSAGALTANGNITSNGAQFIVGTAQQAFTLNGNISGSNNGAQFTIGNQSNNRGITAGSAQQLLIGSSGQSFNPASGNGVLNQLEMQGFAINQSGSANGITRGFYLNPVLTKAADFRALEVVPYTYNLAAGYAGGTLYGVLLNPYTVTGTGTVANAYDLVLTNPIAQVGSTTITTSAALVVSSTAVSASTTNAYGAIINAPTGATTNIALSVNGHENTTSTQPTLSSCGNTPSITGSDTAGTVTSGATANGCTITFATVYKNTPSCVLSEQTGSVVNAFSYTLSTTTIVVSQTGIGGGKFDYSCHAIGE